MTLIILFFKIVFLTNLDAKETMISGDTSWHYIKNVVPEYFEPGFHTVLFGNDINIRVAPSLTSAILDVLPIGQPVQVIAYDTTRLVINSRTACWHMVSWTDRQKKESQGWVWGGYLSLGVGISNDEMFLLGCPEIKESIFPNSPWPSLSYTHEIKVVRDFKLIDRIKLPEVHRSESQVFSFVVDSSRGLSNVKNVVRFNWSGAFCGGLQEDFYALWTEDGHIQLLPTLKSMGEAGAYSDSEQYIFPDERKEVEYKYPLLYFYEKPENNGTILYLREESSGDENGGSISISINKLKFVNNAWAK